MKQVWAIYKIRPLLLHERTDAIILGCVCACGQEVTHDTTRRYLTADGVRETQIKVCARCAQRLDEPARRKTQATRQGARR